MEFVKCLGHPEEFYNLLRFRMGGKQKVIPKMDQVAKWPGPASGAAG
uniref:FDFT1 n=1 Tax=Castor canadensis TaxID=51338 RepID=A0A8C0WMV1_CASCN